MKRLVFASTVLYSLLFGATPEQVEQYLSVSNSEEQLIALQQRYSAMHENLNKESNDTTPYDMQLLSIRFRDYLQKNLSEDEMNEILENYKKTALLHFVSATDETPDPKAMAAYIAQLPNLPDAQERIGIVKEITKHFYAKDAISTLYKKLIKPLFEKGIGAQDIDKSRLKDVEKNYLGMMQEAGYNETLYATKDFDIEELKALRDIAKNSATDHEVKAVYGAIAYALQEFFNTLAKRFDAKQHLSIKHHKKKHLQ